MNNIEFRQAIFLQGNFHCWHHWGFIDGAFVSPETNISSLPEALKHNQMLTTLSDKNNTRIYEGDIVTAGYWGTVGYYGEDTFVVEFEKGAFRGFMNEYRKNKKERWTHSTPIYKLEELEVIGNIYESPHLLDK